MTYGWTRKSWMMDEGGKEMKEREVEPPRLDLPTPRMPLRYFSRVIQNGASLDEETRQDLNKTGPQNSSCWRQVQIWSQDIYNIRPQGIQPCPGIPCGIQLVFDTSYQTLKDSHAVLLYHVSHWNWDELTSHKPKGQKWIFFSHESPINTRNNIIPPQKYINKSYDYLMSFRFRESHLYGSYGYYDTVNPSIALNDTRNWADGRKRKVAWLASNCGNSPFLHWNRTGFVRELSKLVDVGMYGKCGEAGACPSRFQQVNGKDYLSSCNDFLRQFKFYLALENCACRDYMSEKFWNHAYNLDLVPIVFGPSRADYEAVAPPNSFIHVEDFETLQDLADYINLLDRNDHLYNKFFEWKKYGSVVVSREQWLFEPKNMCQVVRRLLADEKAEREGIQTPSLPDLTEWWTNSCRQSIPEFPIKMQRQ
nr:4-galactosyl-N-acetylglucosaminide 3-alpha-L-fucosyltransferase 9-like [Lytechinus pictus]